MKIFQGCALKILKDLPEKSTNCCVTSPPYWGLRDYGIEGQLGLEKTLGEYVSKMVEVFREVKRVLRDDGTLWLNLGDSFASGKGKCFNPGGNTSSFNCHLKAQNVHPLDRGNKSSLAKSGLKPKDLVGVPWRVAFALQADGWYLRSDIIWHKPNPMPESVTDRPTKSHEYIFLMSKNKKYYYDAEAIKEKGVGTEYDKERKPGRMNGTKYMKEGVGQSVMGDNFGIGTLKRNKRSVWTVTTRSFKEAHFATFPPKLIEPCILAGCPEGGTVLDPFSGAGTTGLVALRHNRKYIGIEINPEYVEMSRKRIINDVPLFNKG